MKVNPYINQSISHGTLRTEDLLNAFLPVYQELAGVNGEPVRMKVVREAQKYITYFDAETARAIPTDEEMEEQADIFLNEVMFDEMNRFAPEGFGFQSHPGDGSDFGFWEIFEEDM